MCGPVQPRRPSLSQRASFFTSDFIMSRYKGEPHGARGSSLVARAFEVSAMVKLKTFAVIPLVLLMAFAVVSSSGCGSTQAKQPAPQPMPVKTQTINLAPVPRLDEYVAT